MLKSYLIYLIWVCLMTRMYFDKIWCSPASLPANQKIWSFVFMSLSNKKKQKNVELQNTHTHSKQKKTTTNINTANPFLLSNHNFHELQSSSKPPLLSRQPATKVFNPPGRNPTQLPIGRFPPPWWSNLNFKKSLLAPLSSKDSKTYQGGNLVGSLVVVVVLKVVQCFWPCEWLG